MRRILVAKGLLWFILGGAAILAVVRFARGMGATTALTDLTPWGFWIGFDVMGGVALAAGGFVVAATVYVFHLEKYHAIVRPAVLTAFLGYVAVVGGLLFDLGLPWNIWHMMIYWNPHSPLFEVGWCVMLYTTVLSLEFAPVLFEMAKHPVLAGAYKALKKATVPLVTLGIMLSTLHQSSLGSLFLIMPHRVHPLWYTPILPVMFFVSAVCLGLVMVSSEALVSQWLYHREPELEIVQGLGKAARFLLGGYLLLRFGDIAVRGQLPAVFAGNYESWLFIVEIMLSAVIPLVLFSIPAVRAKPGGLAVAALMSVTGFVMNRIDVGGLAQVGTTGTHYTPSWMEVWMSLGVVAAAALVYFFVAERFNLFHAGPVERKQFRHSLPSFDPNTLVVMPDPYTAGIARYSLAGIFGAAVVLGLLPHSAFAGLSLKSEPAHSSGFGDQIVIDANHARDAVLFPHAKHVAREGGETSCATCHHLNFPGEKATGCTSCHADVYQPTNIFSHKLHAAKIGRGEACATCHVDNAALKDVKHTRACLDCHTKMMPANAGIKPRNAPQLGLAPNYVDAMHGLCIRCHQERAASVNKPKLGECATCHKGDVRPFDPLKPDEDRQRL